jgi:hypothetical protein
LGKKVEKWDGVRGKRTKEREKEKKILEKTRSDKINRRYGNCIETNKQK